RAHRHAPGRSQRACDAPAPGVLLARQHPGVGKLLESAVILATRTAHDLVPGLLATLPTTPPAAGKADPQAGQNTAAPTTEVKRAGQPQLKLVDVERDHILPVLKQTNWVVTGPRGAATILDVHPERSETG